MIYTLAILHLTFVIYLLDSRLLTPLFHIQAMSQKLLRHFCGVSQSNSAVAAARQCLFEPRTLILASTPTTASPSLSSSSSSCFRRYASSGGWTSPETASSAFPANKGLMLPKDAFKGKVAFVTLPQGGQVNHIFWNCRAQNGKLAFQFQIHMTLLFSKTCHK